MSFPQNQSYSSEDYWKLPDGDRAELIGGKLYSMAPPNFLHQNLLMEISGTIREYVKSHGGTCEVVPAPFAVNLDAEDRDWVEPDISVVCDKRKLDDRGCSGAPDWVIEIVSPSSRKHDYSTKNALYTEAGVREYWIVDPAKERVTVYYYEEDAAPSLYTFDMTVTCGIFPDLKISVAELLKEP